MTSDTDDLRDFVRTRSPQAFARMVDRHGRAVFAACKRQLGDNSAAEDATQATFIVLAERARRIGENVVLAGWLFNAARFVCRNAQRTERRRRRYEQEAMSQRPATVTQPHLPAELSAALDDAIAALPQSERDVLLLRFANELDLQQVAAECGLSGAAARKRLSRAVGRMRQFFVRRGLMSSEPAASVDAALLALAGEALTPKLAAALQVTTVSTTSGAGAALAQAALTSMKVKTMKTAATIVIATLTATAATAVVAQTMRQKAPAPAVKAEVRAAVTASAAVAQQNPLDEAERMVLDGEFGQAFEIYGAFLQSLSPEEYRDKKDFGWMIDKLRSKAPQVPDDYDSLSKAVEEQLEAHPDDPIYTWRLHRLAAALAAHRYDTTGQRAALDRAIETYTTELSSDPSKHSSLQHLYNEVVAMIAKQNRDEAEKYLFDHFETDPRFVYIFLPPLRKSIAPTPAQWNALGEKVLASYDRKIEGASADRELLVQFRQQIAEQFKR